MKMKILALFVLFMGSGNLAFGNEVVLKRYLPSKKALVEIKAVQINGVRVSKKCVNKVRSTCMALKAALERNQKSRLSTSVPLLGHPASKNCQDRKGVSLIFLDPKQNEVDYCLFKDDSFINSWDLYHANNKI